MFLMFCFYPFDCKVLWESFYIDKNGMSERKKERKMKGCRNEASLGLVTNCLEDLCVIVFLQFRGRKRDDKYIHNS